MTDCERCRGTGFEIASVAGPDGKEVEVAHRCACQQVAGPDASERRREALRIPPRYEHCTFATFEIGEGSTRLSRDALAMVLRYCSAYDQRGSAHANDKGLGLLFTGGNGTGKTHLAVAVLRELAETHGVRGQFWDYHELMREIRNSYNPATAITEYELLEPVIDLEVLLLDDLGAWKMTDWMNDTLFYILNSRYMAKRSTLITTNFEDADRDKVLAADHLRRKEYLMERIGQRLRSRLMEMCVVIRMQGDDWRQNRQAGNQTLVGGSSRTDRR
jgi:DNA replication protein DnaC